MVVGTDNEKKKDRKQKTDHFDGRREKQLLVRQRSLGLWSSGLGFGERRKRRRTPLLGDVDGHFLQNLQRLVDSKTTDEHEHKQRKQDECEAIRRPLQDRAVVTNHRNHQNNDAHCAEKTHVNVQIREESGALGKGDAERTLQRCRDCHKETQGTKPGANKLDNVRIYVRCVAVCGISNLCVVVWLCGCVVVWLCDCMCGRGVVLEDILCVECVC